MAKLEPEHSRAVAGLLREYGKILCELRAAKDLLAYSSKNKVYPLDWEKILEEMKTKPGYFRPAQALEVIAQHLEQSADEIDLTEVLSKLSKGTAPN